jgi:hypothetical protein
MMEAARTSETLVNFYQTTRHYNPEDSHLCYFELDETTMTSMHTNSHITLESSGNRRKDKFRTSERRQMRNISMQEMAENRQKSLKPTGSMKLFQGVRRNRRTPISNNTS